MIGGAILSAIARDGNNQMFLISWCIVEGENEFSWRWFLERLFEDINVVDGLGLTLVSDQKKGLPKPIKELVPLQSIEIVQGIYMPIGRSYTKDKNSKQFSGRIEDNICTRIRTKIKEAKLWTRYCIVKPAIDYRFQVAVGDDGFVVWLDRKSCSCRAWDLCCISCSHALACIFYMMHLLEDYVNPYFSKTQYISLYKYAVEPLNRANMRPDVNEYKKMPSRPKKKKKERKISLKKKVIPKGV
ncbi:hypothetical protein GH714_038576 [Hevea brasiliensis]|uniref:SWIM-type domain-containing protein n=1 Tax=Hevea brasiliensis TaxID=3981 RepID=A0A6A6N543_HEVBR|nr:hypothetical protein GH714_038576 [Hevea brasiliensis]